MRAMVLSGALALLTATSLAQTSWAQTALSPAASEAQGPANLCQELLAFMKAPPPAAAADKPAATTAKATTTSQAGSTQEASSALAGTAAADKDASAAADDKSGSAQAVTGQGVATDAPQGAADKAAAGSVQNAPVKNSISAPTPPADVTSTAKESVVTVAAVEQLSAVNDIAQCQKSAREMRVAGVDMPPPLMALAALDLQYQQKSGAANAPAQTADPAVND